MITYVFFILEGLICPVLFFLIGPCTLYRTIVILHDAQDILQRKHYKLHDELAGCRRRKKAT